MKYLLSYKSRLFTFLKFPSNNVDILFLNFISECVLC